MYNISMLFLPALLLLTDLHGALAVPSSQTYEYQDPVSGIRLTCDRCQPGTRLAAHCTATRPTECVPCQTEHFTELWNYLPRCLYCNNFCRENQEVERECSAVSNRVCRCTEGHYMNSDFCIRHSECGPGHGVQTTGTLQMNTVCEKCADGHFSNSSSALEPCAKHRDCASSGQRVLLSGSGSHDAVCGSCEDLTREGGVKVLRVFLQQFFTHQRIRVMKMKKFVTRYTQKAGEERNHTRMSLPSQRGPLQGHIRGLLAQAPEEQLKRVPEILRALQLDLLANRVERRFREIQQQGLDCN